MDNQSSGTTRRQMLAIVGGVAVGAGLGGWYRISKGQTVIRTKIRPPGAIDEREFLAACIRCGQCVEVCPTNALIMADITEGSEAETPYMASPATHPCNICAGQETLLCIDVCPTNALLPVADYRDIRMGVAKIDIDVCWAYQGISCRACWHACPYPNEAIYLDELARAVVDRSICVGCGLCVLACPTDPLKAIRISPRCGDTKKHDAEKEIEKNTSPSSLSDGEG